VLEHYVIFQPRPGREADLAEELHVFGEGITGSLPELLEFTWGENTNPSGLKLGYTHACWARLADGGLDAYWVHPAHQKLLSRLDELCQSRFAMDYTTEGPASGCPA
jgi:hypothetical protein